MLGLGWAGMEGGTGAQSQSSGRWDKLKQYLRRFAFAWPVNAIFHSVGSIRAHTIHGDAAAVWRKRRSYPNHVSLSYSIWASMIRA